MVVPELCRYRFGSEMRDEPIFGFNKNATACDVATTPSPRAGARLSKGRAAILRRSPVAKMVSCGLRLVNLAHYGGAEADF